ncbi:MAG: lipase secretion chaperone [Oleiphilus sp.]
MNTILLKRLTLGAVALSALCLLIFQITQSNKPLTANTLELSKQKTDSVITSNKPEAKLKKASTPTQAQLEKTNDVAFQTPSTFPDGPFAPSIADTEIDGSLKADANGKLIIDLETRDLFDYFMNTVADVPPEVALAELEKLARAHLPESAVNEVMALLGDYLLYKETALSYSKQTLLPADQQDEHYHLQMLEQSFESLKEIRRSTMSHEAVEAFFGLEEAYGEFTLASIKIQQNPDLSEKEKQLELQTQRERLPEIIRNTESRMVEEMATAQDINQMLLSNASDSEVESYLRQHGLEEATIKEAISYRKQQFQFEETYQLYQKERDQLLSSGLSEQDLKTQKQRLLEKYFESEHAITQAKVKDLSS